MEKVLSHSDELYTHGTDIRYVADERAGYPEKLNADNKPGDAGIDLRCTEDFTLLPHNFISVGTGLSMEIPDGYVGLVCPRSGLATKYGISIVNTPGIVDSGYRGEIKVCLINHGEEVFRTEAGARIAQLVIVPCLMSFRSRPPVHFLKADSLTETARGDSGFGSTGI